MTDSPAALTAELTNIQAVVVANLADGGTVWEQDRADLQALALADMAASLRTIATALKSLDDVGINTYPA